MKICHPHRCTPPSGEKNTTEKNIPYTIHTMYHWASTLQLKLYSKNENTKHLWVWG